MQFSPVILWFDLQHKWFQQFLAQKIFFKAYQKFREIPLGEVTFYTTFLAIFSKIQGFPELFYLCIILTIQIWY